MAQKNTQKKSEEAAIEEKILQVVGIVKAAKRGTTDYDKDVKNRLAIKTEDLDIYDEIEAYKNSGPKFTPDWFKNAEGFINLTSKYDIPVMNADGERISFEEWISSGVALGASVKLKFKSTDGAVYPIAIKVLEDGEPFDPFEDM